MSIALPPKTVSSIYSPAYFEAESSTNIDITKVDKIAGTATNLTLAGSITGIDIGDVNGLQSALDGISIDPSANIQSNEAFPLTADGNIKPWGTDLVCYLDFADSKNIGRDCTGNNHHASVKGATYLADSTRKHCANFIPILNGNANVEYSNQNHIELSAHAPSFALPEYTISVWYYCTSASGNHAVVSLVDSTNALSHFSILHSSGSTRILCYNNSVAVLNVIVATTENAWHHVGLTMTSSGNAIYVDGSLITSYSTGSASTYLDMSSPSTFFVPNCVSLGSTRGPNGTLGYNVETQYKFPLNGRISDFSFWNRALSASEIGALYADNYGYCVYMLCGQSNMVGLGNTNIPFDYDYSLHKGRVYQFDSYNNVKHTSGIISAGNPYAIVSPYNCVHNAILQVTSSGVCDNLHHPLDIGSGYGLGTAQTVGLWKTFTDDLMQYATIPYRKKVLLLPCAIGSTGFLSQWSPGMSCYEMTKNVANEVLNPTVNVLNKFNRLQGFLWNQGEQSIVELDTNFLANFQAMIAGFQTDIPGFVINLPIVVAQTAGNSYDSSVATLPVPDVQMKKLINDSYALLDSQNSNITMVTTLGDTQFQSDLKHLDSASYRALGYKYYDAFCKSANMTNRKQTDPNRVITLNQTYGNRNIGFTLPIALPPPPTLNTESITYTSLPVGGCVTCTLVSASATGLKSGGVSGIGFTFTKLGPLVIMSMTTAISFTVDLGTGTVLTFGAGTIPSAYQPVTDAIVLCTGRLNGNATITNTIDVRIDNDGSITFTPTGGVNYTNLQAQYINAFTACYTATPNAF